MQTGFEIVPPSKLLTFAVNEPSYFRYYFSTWASPLHFSANFGHLSLHKYLTEKILKYQYGTGESIGAIKNPKNERGIGPLQIAVKKGDLDLFLYISKDLQGINPKNRNGLRILRDAVKSGNFDIVKIIIDNAKDKNSSAIHDSFLSHHVIHNAVEFGNFKIFKYIFESEIIKITADRRNDMIAVARCSVHLDIYGPDIYNYLIASR